MSDRKLEAWAVESPGGNFIINMRRSLVPEGFKEHRFVEADPSRDRVYRAVMKWAKLGYPTSGRHFDAVTGIIDRARTKK